MDSAPGTLECVIDQSLNYQASFFVTPNPSLQVACGLVSGDASQYSGASYNSHADADEHHVNIAAQQRIHSNGAQQGAGISDMLIGGTATAAAAGCSTMSMISGISSYNYYYRNDQDIIDRSAGNYQNILGNQLTPFAVVGQDPAGELGEYSRHIVPCGMVGRDAGLVNSIDRQLQLVQEAPPPLINLKRWTVGGGDPLIPSCLRGINGGYICKVARSGRSTATKVPQVYTERQRRKIMSSLFATLRSLLPFALPKNDRYTIVSETIRYIAFLEETLEQMRKKRCSAAAREFRQFHQPNLLAASYAQPSYRKLSIQSSTSAQPTTSFITLDDKACPTDELSSCNSSVVWNNGASNVRHDHNLLMDNIDHQMQLMTAALSPINYKPFKVAVEDIGDVLLINVSLTNADGCTCKAILCDLLSLLHQHNLDQIMNASFTKRDGMALFSAHVKSPQSDILQTKDSLENSLENFILNKET